MTPLLDADPRDSQPDTGFRWTRLHTFVVGVLLLIEVVVSITLTSINPVITWDENFYVVAGRHLAFGSGFPLPYPHHRPPLLPILIALFGEHYRLVPALAHIGSVITLLLILRRLASPKVAIAGMTVLMVSGDLRFYGMLVLTEIVSIFLLLQFTYLMIKRRPMLAGAVASLLVLSHWQMIFVLPTVVTFHLLRRHWDDCVRLILGAAATLTPFFVASFVIYGNPVEPLLRNLRMNTIEFADNVGHPVPNDVLFYARFLPLGLWVVFLGALIAAAVAVIRRRQWTRAQHDPLCALLVLIAIVQLIPMHLVIPKDTRLIVPLIPLLLIAWLIAADQLAQRKPWTRYIAWPTIFASVFAVMPGRNLLWEIHDMRSHPIHQVADFRNAIAATDPNEVLYSDVNDLAVMGHTLHRVVPVLDMGNHYTHVIQQRGALTRKEIPTGALYLTWDPGNGIVLGKSKPGKWGVLYFVRWRKSRRISQSPKPCSATNTCEPIRS